VLTNVAFSDDITATLKAGEKMGLCGYRMEKGALIIEKSVPKPPLDNEIIEIDCNESGSTLRFCLPLAMDGTERWFTGRGRLMERPLEPYEEICRKQNIKMIRSASGIMVRGELNPDIFIMRGDISSQFISGLLFALPRLKGDSRIIFNTKLESKPYVDITMDIQKKYGVHTEFSAEDIVVYGNQKYRNTHIEIEGDFSHAAFFAVGAALSGEVTMEGLSPDSLQGDREIFDILKRAGAQVDGYCVKKSNMRALDIDVSQIPDLVPVLCVLACGIKGTTTIYNAARLRLKESDRLSAMTQELTKLGAVIREYEDKLVIEGGSTLRGASVDSHGDHRIAMALATASCITEGIIFLDNPNVVSKSAPFFYSEFKRLGGIVK
jgi:3-phosphoshikimate 1-carboxyvinyltransferase